MIISLRMKVRESVNGYSVSGGEGEVRGFDLPNVRRFKPHIGLGCLAILEVGRALGKLKICDGERGRGREREKKYLTVRESEISREREEI